MKKFVSVFAVIMLIVNALLVALSCITLFPSEGMGAWLVGVYEGLTNELGVTADVIYGKFRVFCNWANLVSMVISWVLIVFMYSYIKNHTCKCAHEEALEEVPAEETTSTEKVSRSKKVETARKVVETVKDGKKAAKAVKKAAKDALVKGLSTLVEETSGEEVTKEQISAEEQFLASLRKR